MRLRVRESGLASGTVPGAVATGFHRKRLLRKHPVATAPGTVPHMALWWIEAGHIPTVEEARERLDHLRKHGESEFAFTFKRVYAPQAYESSYSR